MRSLRILCTACRVPRYEPVEDAAVYSVVIPEYLVNGGDGYAVIGDEMIKHSSGECRRGNGCHVTPGRRLHPGSSPPPGDLDVSVVSRYIRERGLVFPALEGRISFYSGAPGPGRNAALVLLAPLLLIWAA